MSLFTKSREIAIWDIQTMGEPQASLENKAGSILL